MALGSSIISWSGLMTSLPFCHPKNASQDAKFKMVSGWLRGTASTREGYNPNAKWRMALPALGECLSRVLPPSFPRVKIRRSPPSKSIPHSAIPFNAKTISISCARRTRLSPESNSGHCWPRSFSLPSRSSIVAFGKEVRTRIWFAVAIFTASSTMFGQ